MKYTKKQRHEIYKKALKATLNNNKYAVAKIFRIYAPSPDSFLEVFPEIFTVDSINYSELPKNEFELKKLQQLMLMFCIEMTK